MSILVTGGSGYIGCHTVVELLHAGHEVVIVDNLSNSKAVVLDRIQKITGKKAVFYKADLRDKDTLNTIFKTHKIDHVLYFAGLKAVGESVNKPLEYYDNNIGSTLSLLEVMSANNVKSIVFSSSATVYGNSAKVPFKESDPTGVSLANPYGYTKFMIEQILKDLSISDDGWSVVTLRYFNPVGAHSSGLIGENPNGIPNNLMPFISQVAVGKLEKLKIFGHDYPTKDGTAIRDYIHVVDLSKAHVLAVKMLSKQVGFNVYNIGTGKGISVLEAVKGFVEATGVDVPYEFVGRRIGDVTVSYADVSKANKLLGWKSELTFQDACKDTWRWQSNNFAENRTH